MWYSPSFLYRQSIKIENGSASDLENYTFIVTIDHASLVTAGKSNADGSDLRFTESEQGPLLPHWVESGLNTSSCVIWIKLNSLKANSTDTYYMYYGNVNAVDVSSGDNTFLFFDDFSTEDNTKWTYGEAFDGTAAMSYEVIGGLLRIYSSGSAWKVLRMRRTWSPDDNIIVKTRFKTAGNSYWQQTVFANKYSTIDDRFGFQDVTSDAPIRFRYFKFIGGAATYGGYLTTLSADTWYKSEIQKKSSTSFTGKVFTDAETQIDSVDATDAGWESIWWTWLTWQYENVNCYYDWVIVRKYGTDPTTTFGTEESKIETPKYWGLRITKPGIDLDEAELEDYVLDTTQNRLKLHMKGSGIFTMPSNGLGYCSGGQQWASAAFTVYHGLPYVPMVWFFAQDVKTGRWHCAPSFIPDLIISVMPAMSPPPDMIEDPTRLKFWIGRADSGLYGNDTSNVAHIKYKYFIFLDPALDAWYE